MLFKNTCVATIGELKLNAILRKKIGRFEQIYNYASNRFLLPMGSVQRGQMSYNWPLGAFSIVIL